MEEAVAVFTVQRKRQFRGRDDDALQIEPMTRFDFKAFVRLFLSYRDHFLSINYTEYLYVVLPAHHAEIQMTL